MRNYLIIAMLAGEVRMDITFSAADKNLARSEAMTLLEPHRGQLEEATLHLREIGGLVRVCEVWADPVDDRILASLVK